MSKVDFTDLGTSYRLSLLSNKIVLILLKYQRGEPLVKKEKEALLRGKDLILDKLLRFAKLIEGEKIKDESGLWDGMKLYGYALTSLNIFEDNYYVQMVISPSEGLRFSKLFDEFSAVINNISTCKEPICSSVLTRMFFESFEKQIRPHREC